MTQWTDQGQALVNQVASRYGASSNAVSLMLDSVLRGGGTMAQFNIQELGGSGQWMRGGMTMVGDMFNQSLQSRVAGMCEELASAILDQQIQVVPPPTSSSGGGGQWGGNTWGNWWPAELGSPNSSGSQNQYRYAYFASSRRLAINDGQTTRVYDTLDHQIGGVSQQQGGDATLRFTSQYGTVDLRSLPLLPDGGGQSASNDRAEPAASDPSPRGDENAYAVGSAPMQSFGSTSQPAGSTMGTDSPPQANQSAGTGGGSRGSQSLSPDEILTLIDRLAKLRDSGAISPEDYDGKKAELLGRL